MRLLWRPLAIRDRLAIMEYIAIDNPAAATQLDEEIERSARRASERPLACRVGRVTGTRELLVRPSYMLVFRMKGDAIEVLRVSHTARQWPI